MKKLLVMLLVSLPLTAHADDFARHMAATRLVEYMNAQNPFDSELAPQTDMLLAGYANVPCASQTLPEIAKVLASVLNYNTLKPYLIRSYEETFTLQELNEIDAFFRTKSGAHLLHNEPELMRNLQQTSATLIKEKQDQIKAINAKYVDDKGQCKIPTVEKKP